MSNTRPIDLIAIVALITAWYNDIPFWNVVAVSTLFAFGFLVLFEFVCELYRKRI